MELSRRNFLESLIGMTVGTGLISELFGSLTDSNPKTILWASSFFGSDFSRTPYDLVIASMLGIEGADEIAVNYNKRFLRDWYELGDLDEQSDRLSLGIEKKDEHCRKIFKRYKERIMVGVPSIESASCAIRDYTPDLFIIDPSKIKYFYSYHRKIYEMNKFMEGVDVSRVSHHNQDTFRAALYLMNSVNMPTVVLSHDEAYKVFEDVYRKVGVSGIIYDSLFTDKPEQLAKEIFRAVRTT